MKRLTALLSKLNGWQRLWLLAVSAWLPLSVWINAADFPTAERLRDRARHALEWGYSALRENAEQQTEHCKQLIKQERYTAVTLCFQMANEAHANATRMVDLGMERFEDGLGDRLVQAQAEVAGKIFLFWLAPALVVYLCGLAVAWALKGFKRQPPA